MHPAGQLFGEDAVDKAVSRHTAHAGKAVSAQNNLEMGLPALAPAAVAGMLVADVAHLDLLRRKRLFEFAGYGVGHGHVLSPARGICLPAGGRRL